MTALNSVPFQNLTISVQDSIEQFLLVDTSWVQLDIYRWYAEGYRYPVFETVQTTLYQNQQPRKHFNTAFLYSLDEQQYSLDQDIENLTYRENLIAEKEWSQMFVSTKSKATMSQQKGEFYSVSNDFIDCRIIVSDNILTIEYILKQDTTLGISLFDLQGRLLARYPQGDQKKGTYKETVSLQYIQQHELLFRIEAGSKIFGIKIMK